MLRVIISLLLTSTFCFCAFAQPSDVSIAVSYTPEQKQVVKKFQDNYFEDTRLFKKEGDITVSQFLAKDAAAQDAFMKDWAIKKRQTLTTREAQVVEELNDIHNQLDELDKAIASWGN